MGNYQYHFHRQEKKYLLDKAVYGKLLGRISDKLKYDRYGKYKICNIYFDTPDFLLIRNSISKPLYKEKLRLRSYGVPDEEAMVHLEIKKKYDGVVYKRRVTLPYKEAMHYCIKGQIPEESGQILHEIDWFLCKYDLFPALYLSYDRLAMEGKEEKNLRITFDYNLRWRKDQLDLTCGDFGSTILDENQYIMEIKTDGAMPLWLCHALSELNIYPSSFSKYGTVYQKELAKEINHQGGIIYAD